MHKYNISYVFLLGFPNFHSFNILLFMFLLFIYCITIFVNVMIILLVLMSRKLHRPMYFFITQVSLLDILMSTDILPNLLHIILHGGGTMSLTACILQFYVFAYVDSFECFIFLVMSYDRYVAICNPLQYNSIINKTFCWRSILISWLLVFLLMAMHVIDIYQLDFCGPNAIDHFFCDYPPILELSCSDTSLVLIHTTLFGIIVGILPFTLIIVSYVCIINTILNIQSVTGRQKAFSTCSSHMTVVSIFFGTLLSVHIVPNNGDLLVTSKIISFLYTMVTPLLNPFIYSLRNKDFKEAYENVKKHLVFTAIRTSNNSFSALCK